METTSPALLETLRTLILDAQEAHPETERIAVEGGAIRVLPMWQFLLEQPDAAGPG